MNTSYQEQIQKKSSERRDLLLIPEEKRVDGFILGEELNKHLLSPTTLFDFRAYKNLLDCVTKRNKKLFHKTSGRELIEIIGRKTIEVLKDPNVKEEVIKYNSPSAILAAGLYFEIGVNDGNEAYRRILTNLHKIETDVRLHISYPNQTISLMNGVFEITYEENKILIKGNDNKSDRTRRDWRGKACDLANFLSVISHTIGSLKGKPLRLSSSGLHTYGLDIMIYETQRSHDYEYRLPTKIIGRITEKAQSDSRLETKVYAGNEVELLNNYVEHVFE